MDNGAICRGRQENTLRNTKIVKVLGTKNKPSHEEIPGKQPTQNSQNKFDLPSFKCEVCPYESIWKHAVKRHQQTHYKGQNISEGHKKAKYKCETCSYTANNWTILKDHLKLHTSPNEKIQAEKDTPTLNITEQEEKQIGESPHEPESNKMEIYTCKLCKYKTSYKVVFESHKKVHLPNKEEEVFRCDLCSFSSVYRQSFLRHMKTIHENGISKEDDGLPSTLHCQYCGIASACKEQFEKHVKMHKEKKPNLDDGISDAQSQNNNLPQQDSKPVESQEITPDSVQNECLTVSPNPTLKTVQVQKPNGRTRRGKYSDVPVKTTKNGLFECVHCSYQTAIRTALVKHQTNHLKNSNS